MVLSILTPPTVETPLNDKYIIFMNMVAFIIAIVSSTPKVFLIITFLTDDDRMSGLKCQVADYLVLLLLLLLSSFSRVRLCATP